jgi:hypothetical protein
VITSELVTPSHRARKAIIYIRQSTPHQVLSNQESLQLQYALEQRALNLGWQPDDIEIIDADLGLTAVAAQHREGFKEIVSRVTLGQVGIILSSEVTRLSRNCSDWYPLLDICGYKHCLIADNDHALLIPRRDRFGDLVWKKPSVAAILYILKNPAYAGAFVYGRSKPPATLLAK